MHWDRASGELNKVLFFSRHEAARMGTHAIEPRDLLLALRHARDKFIARLLPHSSFNEIRGDITAGAPRLEPTSDTADFHYTADAERVLKHAAAEADRLKRPYVGTGHLLLALLREQTTASLLERRGVRLEDVSAALEEAAHVPPGFNVDTSTTPELTLAAYDPTLHPEFAGMLGTLANLKGAAAHSAVLTNISTERVTAVVARWIIAGHDGAVSTKYVVRDSYFPINRGNPLEPGHRLLATPDSLSEALDVSKPYAWVSAGTRSDEDASSRTVGLDSAVFENGRLVGPDVHDIADYVQGRYAAARRLARLIKDAEAAGEDVEAMFNAMRLEPSKDRWWWLSSLARHRPSAAKGWLDLAEPPQFFRSA
jgi:hypothetical protein